MERKTLPTHRRESTPGRNPDGGEAVVVSVSERVRIAAVDVRSVETDHGPARDAVIGPEREAFAGDKRIAAVGEIQGPLSLRQVGQLSERDLSRLMAAVGILDTAMAGKLAADRGRAGAVSGAD